MPELLIRSARHQCGHILDIEFNDDEVRVVDFAPFIFSDSHPDHERYKRIDNFLDFKIIDGNLNWDDYTMIFPVEDIYHNRLLKRR